MEVWFGKQEERCVKTINLGPRTFRLYKKYNMRGDCGVYKGVINSAKKE